MEDTIGVREAWTSFTHKFFGKSSQSEETVSSSTTTDAPAKSATETFFSKEVEEKIQALIKENNLLSNGKVSFVSLKTIREKLGDKWPRYKATVSQLAKTVIEKRTTPRDVHYTIGDDVYVFVFADLNQQEAMIKCSLIAKEIGEHIFGADWTLEQFSTSVAVGETDGSISLTQESLSDAILNSLSEAKEFHPADVLNHLDPKAYDDTLNRINQGLDTVEMTVNSLNMSEIEKQSPASTIAKFTTIIQEIQKAAEKAAEEARKKELISSR